MQSFAFHDAIRFRIATQQEDTGAKIQAFLGVLIGVLLRWVYAVAVVVIRNNTPWCFGDWKVILIHLALALHVTVFVFSGYWQQVKDEPPSMRFWNAMARGITTDVIVSSLLPPAVS